MIKEKGSGIKEQLSGTRIIPKGFEEEMIELLGTDEAGKLAEALGETVSPVSIRLNPRKQMSGTLYDGMIPIPWNRNGFFLAERPSFTDNPLLHAGLFYVQEAASMIYGRIVADLEFKSPISAVDLCGAPGGKTGAVLDFLPDGSVMVANEFVGKRANILFENMAKQGYPDIIVTNSDVAVIGRLGSTFDLMIADVPCSGEGMMRKEEIARTQWSPSLIRQCQGLQREILNNGLRALRPGGYLIYSTCTFNRVENEDNVRWLIKEHGLENVPLDFPAEWNIASSLDSDINALRFFPHKTPTEGLFVALLRKPEYSETVAPESHNLDFRKKKGKKVPDKNSIPDLNVLKKWVRGSDYVLTDDDHGNVRAMSPQTAAMDAKLRNAGIRVISAGIEIASVKGRDFVPSGSFALSTGLASDAFPSVEVSEDIALDYLRHEAIRLPADTPKGFVIVKYKNFPLGFVKNIGNRANNMYPSEWRIRKNKV